MTWRLLRLVERCLFCSVAPITLVQCHGENHGRPLTRRALRKSPPLLFEEQEGGIVGKPAAVGACGC
jgi:hypothetical protein